MPFDNANASLATKMREIFGPNGEHWGKKYLFKNERYCLLGAALTALGIRTYTETVVELLYPALSAEGSSLNPTRSYRVERAEVTNFNDDPSRTWEDISKFLDRLEEIETAEVSSAYAQERGDK